MEKPKITFLPAGKVIQQILSGKPFTLVYARKNRSFCYKTTVLNTTTASVAIKTKTKGGKFEHIGTIFLISKYITPISNSGVKEIAATYGLFLTYWNLLQKNTPSMDIVYWPPRRCAKCKRLLTDPSSIMNGMGPRCRAHVA